MRASNRTLLLYHCFKQWHSELPLTSLPIIDSPLTSSLNIDALVPSVTLHHEVALNSPGGRAGVAGGFSRRTEAPK